MARERKGWGAERKKPVSCARGIILYKGRGKGNLVIDFPDEERRYGRHNTAQVVTLMVWLAEGASLKEARKMAGM